jgi:dihydrofolate reductase
MITIIAAIAENNALGKDNQLIWHLPADLKRFKKVTLGHHIIMGRKTFESLGKPLPNRTTIIITRNKGYKQEGCIVVNSLQEAIEAASADKNPYILGGAEIYKQAMEIADKLDLTLVHHNFDADAFFPEINFNKWKEISRENFKADENNKYNYSFVTYVKNKKKEVN